MRGELLLEELNHDLEQRLGKCLENEIQNIIVKVLVDTGS